MNAFLKQNPDDNRGFKKSKRTKLYWATKAWPLCNNYKIVECY